RERLVAERDMPLGPAAPGREPVLPARHLGADLLEVPVGDVGRDSPAEQPLHRLQEIRHLPPSRSARRRSASRSPTFSSISAFVPFPCVSVRASRASFSAGQADMTPRPPKSETTRRVTSIAASVAYART